MLKFANMFLAVIFIVGTAKVEAQSVLTNGLVAYYPFNGDVRDYSGYGNSTPIGSVTFGRDRFGNANGSAVFFGTNFLGYPDAPQLHFVTNVTLSAWVCTTQYTADPTHLYGIVTKGMPNPNVGPQLGITTRSSQMVTLGEVNGLLQDIVSTQPVNDGNWRMLTFTVNSASQLATLYVNGTDVSSTSYPGVTISNTSLLLIGLERTTNFFFVGNINDVRVYNRALSASEVQQLYNYDIMPNISNPRLSAGNFSFNFSAVSNLSYTVQQNTSLTTTNWIYCTNIIGAAGLYQFIAPIASRPQNFYRVKTP